MLVVFLLIIKFLENVMKSAITRWLFSEKFSNFPNVCFAVFHGKERKSPVMRHVCVSGGKKSLFFGNFGVLCFLETPVLTFALLPYYRRNKTKKHALVSLRWWAPSYTMWKVSVFGVFLVHIQSECGKILTRKTPNTDTFYAVLIIRIMTCFFQGCKQINIRIVYTILFSECELVTFNFMRYKKYHATCIMAVKNNVPVNAPIEMAVLFLQSVNG